jgi:hypothetical protein
MGIQDGIVLLLRKATNSVAYVLQLLADGTDTSSENGKSNNAAKGGVLNFRTDDLDDGVDSAGWYEKD